MQIVSVESRDLLCSVYMFARRYEGGSLLGLGSLCMLGGRRRVELPTRHEHDLGVGARGMKREVGAPRALALHRVVGAATTLLREGEGGQLRGGVGVGEAAADRAAVANLRVGDVWHRFVQQR